MTRGSIPASLGAFAFPESFCSMEGRPCPKVGEGSLVVSDKEPRLVPQPARLSLSHTQTHALTRVHARAHTHRHTHTLSACTGNKDKKTPLETAKQSLV